MATLSETVDAMLEEIHTREANGDTPFPALEVNDNGASALRYKLLQVRQEIERGEVWWEERKRSLKRQEQWLKDSIAAWATITHKNTGMKSFPCGDGMVKVYKAKARTVWDEEKAAEWIHRLLRFRPDLAREVRKGEIAKLIDWSEPDENGVRTAFVAVDRIGSGTDTLATGEILPGLTKEERIGEFHVSIE